MVRPSRSHSRGKGLNKVRLYPPRHTRSLGKSLLPTVQQKGERFAPFLGDDHSATYHVEQTDQRPVRSLNPGHNRPPGSYLHIVHFVRSVEWKEGAVHTAPPLLCRIYRPFGSFAFGQVRQFEPTTGVNLSSASRSKSKL